MTKCISCGSENVQQYGPYAGRVVPGGELGDIKDQTVQFKCFDCDFVAFQKELTSVVRIITSHIVKEGRAEDVQRVIVRFISDEPEADRLIKEFYIWLTNIFVQDYLRLPKRAQQEDFLRAAISVAESEYSVNRDTPRHNGIDCRNSGSRQVVDPTTYDYPVAKQV